MSVLNGKEEWLLGGNWEDQKYDSLGAHTQTNKQIPTKTKNSS